MTTPLEVELAGADTLLGLLQRGRGDGYIRALREPEQGGGLVVECILNDPRVDHQVENRGWFYASLLVRLGVDLTLLRAVYEQPADQSGDDAAWLTVDVLSQAAEHGAPGAVSELRRYLRSGRDFELGFCELVRFNDHPEAAGILEEALALADDETLESALSGFNDFTARPWPRWRAASERLDRSVRGVLDARAPAGPRLAARTRSQARQTAERNRLIQIGVAAAPGTPIADLARLTDPSQDDVLLNLAPDLLVDDTLSPRTKRVVRRFLLQLRSPAALAWSRERASIDDWLGSTAASLLAGVGDSSDDARLRELLRAAVATGNDGIYLQADLVRGLARIGSSSGITMIEDLFDTTGYSYLRRRCAVALHSLSGDFGDHRAIEALYDCESDTRAVAVSAVNPNHARVGLRLAEIARDPTETVSNRNAAATVLLSTNVGSF